MSGLSQIIVIGSTSPRRQAARKKIEEARWLRLLHGQFLLYLLNTHALAAQSATSRFAAS
jgi:hypothetical protein